MDGNNACVILEFSPNDKYKGSIALSDSVGCRGNAHSRYYSEDAYAAAVEPKELVIVPDADHVALYDNMEKIPFDKLKQLFNGNLR